MSKKPWPKEHFLQDYFEENVARWRVNTRRAKETVCPMLYDYLWDRPAEIYTLLSKNRKPYTVKTYFSHLSNMYAWALDRKLVKGTNPWCEFYEQNKRMFQNAYQPKIPDLTLEQCLEKISRITNPIARKRAIILLRTGLRAEEIETYDPKTKTVIGKGGRQRHCAIPKELLDAVFHTDSDGRLVKIHMPYSTLRYQLARFGLCPHMIRKINLNFLTQRTDIDPFTLQAHAGWKSIETSRSYINMAQHTKKMDVYNEQIGDAIEAALKPAV